MWREGTDKRAVKLYKYSISYLSGLFALIGPRRGGAPVLLSRVPRLMLGALSSLALAIALVACGGDTLQTETGVVTDVRSTGLVVIDGFTLRTSDGRELTSFHTTQTRFDAAGFPPQHLQEHRALAEPVRVTDAAKDGTNRVIKLEDAAE